MLALELTQHQFGHALEPLPKSVAVPVGLLVFVAFVLEGIWRLARHITVIAHEGAHVATCWIMGARVTGVTLESNATGQTVSIGPNGLGGSSAASPATWARASLALAQRSSLRWTISWRCCGWP